MPSDRNVKDFKHKLISSGIFEVFGLFERTDWLIIKGTNLLYFVREGGRPSNWFVSSSVMTDESSADRVDVSLFFKPIDNYSYSVGFYTRVTAEDIIRYVKPETKELIIYNLDLFLEIEQGS